MYLMVLRKNSHATMLHKLLNFQKRKPSHTVPPPEPPSVARPEDGMSSVLKIVHAGGFVERYYMAIPAAEVMKKYPSFLLTKPEVFKRPWESVVQPDEILTPGGKYFVVPRSTVKKLRRRIRRPSKEVSAKSSESKSSKDVLKRNEVQQGETSYASSGGRMKSAAKKHVTFSGIDVKHKVRQMDKPR